MGRRRVLSVHRITNEVLTLGSVCFMMTVQFGEIESPWAANVLGIVMFANFIYQLGSCLWRLFGNVQEHRKLVYGVFNFKNAVELGCICVLVLCFAEASLPEGKGLGVPKRVVAVSAGYLLSRVHEVLDYSTLQYYWCKMAFSTAVVAATGIAARMEIGGRKHGELLMEFAYAGSAALMVLELFVDGRVIEKIVSRRRRFSIVLALLLVAAISSPYTYPIARKYAGLLAGWVSARVMSKIGPIVEKVSGAISKVKEKVRALMDRVDSIKEKIETFKGQVGAVRDKLKASKEQINTYMKTSYEALRSMEWKDMQGMAKDAFQKALYEKMPNIKEMINTKIREYMASFSPREYMAKFSPKSMLSGWWGGSQAAQDAGPGMEAAVAT